MFGYCSNLINAPKLKITNVPNYGCINMFAVCTSLTQAPDLDVKTIGNHGCYGMFQQTALTKAPTMLDLESFTGNSSVEAMFYGCSKLKVNENGTTGTKIFTCPITSGLTDTTKNMFTNTAGSFAGTPTEGNTYNYYE